MPSTSTKIFRFIKTVLVYLFCEPSGLLPKNVAVVSTPFRVRSCRIASEDFRLSASVKGVKPEKKT